MILLRNIWVVPVSFLAAMLLLLVPLPTWAHPFRPDWVALVMLFWCISLPRLFGIGAAWLTGIMIDVMYGTLFGEHAVAYAVIAFIAVAEHQRLRVAPLGQQALVIGILLFIEKTILLIINGVIGQAPQNYALYFAPVVLGILLWPWIYLLLNDTRRHHSLG